MEIGSFHFKNNLMLAPMAGVTDKPFRMLCRSMGAGAATSEMISANAALWNSEKTRARINHTGEASPHIVQIVGADPDTMAKAAQFNVVNGAQIIDINMGCPAKKICRTQAGSALLSNLPKVEAILRAVITAVEIPVTLKIRTGPDRANKNALQVAHLAQDCGIKALTIHGRTRADRFAGQAEYNTIKNIKQAVDIPVIANGDIDSPQKAARVLMHTGADALMIGRAAQGNPWIFREINTFLKTGKQHPRPTATEVKDTLLWHIHELYKLYGEPHGLRIARKHIAWYCKNQTGSAHFRKLINQVQTSAEQIDMINNFFSPQQTSHLTMMEAV